MENFNKFDKVPIKLTALVEIPLGFHQPNQTFVYTMMIINFTILIITRLQPILFIIDPRTRRDFISTISALSCWFIVLESMIKHYITSFYKSTLRGIIGELNEMYKNYNEDELKRFNENSKVVRITANTYAVSSFILITIFNTLPIFIIIATYFKNGTFIILYPFDFWWPFDIPEMFVLTYIYTLYFGSNSTCCLYANDLLYMTIATNISINYDILKTRVVKVNDNGT